MNILALDPALSCGYAWSDGATMRHGLWQLAASGSEHAGKPLIRLEDFIIDAHKAWGVDRIAFEAAGFGTVHPAVKQFHNGVRGVILLTAAKIGATWIDYSPSTIKKFATGHGHAKKDQMIAALNRHFGLTVTSHDVADAIWILKYAQNQAINPLAKLAAEKPRAVRARRKKEPELF